MLSANITYMIRFLILMVLFVCAPLAASADYSNKSRSITIYGQSPSDYGSAGFRTVIDNAVGLGVNTVGLIADWHQDDVSSSTLSRGYNTPIESDLIAGIRYAKGKGLQVNLIVRPENRSGEWRANIDPSNRDGWFASYGDILNRYASLAQREGVDTMTLGTEMYKVTSVTYNSDNEQRWDVMISGVKQRFDGKLTYGAQHSGDRSEIFEVNFWPQLDYIGISAYYNLSGGKGTTLKGRLMSRWAEIDRDYITKAARQYGKKVSFTELGYRNIEDSYIDPWNPWVVRPRSDDAQAIAYDALLTYWQNKDYFEGWSIWAFDTDASRRMAQPTSFTPQGKKALEVLREWYGGSGTPSNPTDPADPAVPSVHPACVSALSDPDGDGYGWENNKSCIVTNASADQDPDDNGQACIDPDGDGWGWDGSASCVVGSPDVVSPPNPTTPTHPLCVSALSDPDGDGWGWENSKSCIVQSNDTPPTVITPSTVPVCPAGTIDHDDNGYGWDSRLNGGVGAGCLMG